MQEQNFEKQVKDKMEELSLTPSEPVWKKINEQVRKKRDHRRIFLWLPLAALLLGGGVWFFSDNFEQNSDVQVNNSLTETSNKEERIESNNIKVENGSSRTIDETTTNEPAIPGEKLENKTVLIKGKAEEKKSVNAIADKQKTVFVNAEKNINTTARKNTINTNQTKGNLSGNKTQTLNQTKQPLVSEFSNPDKTLPSKETNQAVAEDLLENKMPSDSGIQRSNNEEEKIAVENTNAPDSASNKSPESVEKADSLTIDNTVAAATRKSVSKRWQFALEAGIGSSGVNNGINVFSGGAQSLETNAFARDMNLSFSSPSNSSQGPSFSKPPSTQKKSGSFLFGLLAKKQLSKRSFLTTGLRYNFYSTTMKVGQNVNRDTVVEANKSVGSFYTNSGNSFSDYHNNFHFISVPVNLDFQLLRKLPLDFHVGLSLQQLIHTNALLYSASSQVYYNHNEVFNKTYFFSELGLEYSFPLAKGLSLRTGPRASYSLSKVIKASDRHLFSYGLVTQLVFSGK